MRRANEKSIKEGKYTQKEMEIIKKEMEKKVSSKEAPALNPYGYKEGDVMKNTPGTLKHWLISFEEYKSLLSHLP